MSWSVIVSWGLHVCTKKMERCSCLCLWPFQFIPHLGTYYTELCVCVLETVLSAFDEKASPHSRAEWREKGEDRECHGDWWAACFSHGHGESEADFLFLCLPPPPGENGNSQHWTDAVNTTLQKKGWEGCSLRQSGTDGGSGSGR